MSVLGVIVAAAAPFAAPELTIARKAAVLGEGGGKATGPPTRGVRPVEGVRPVRNEPDASNPKSGGCIEPELAARAAIDAAGWDDVTAG